METITIQGHRGLRTITVKRKRNFLSQPKEQGVVTPVVATKTVERKETPIESPVTDLDKDMAEYEAGLLAMLGQFNEESPKRSQRRKQPHDNDDQYSSKQPYRRDKSWRK